MTAHTAAQADKLAGAPIQRKPGQTNEPNFFARFVEAHAPDSVALVFRYYGRDNPMSPADRARFERI